MLRKMLRTSYHARLTLSNDFGTLHSVLISPLEGLIVTIAELNALYNEKVTQKNPLRFPDSSMGTAAKVDTEFLEQCRAETEYNRMLANAADEIYLTLEEELGMTRGEIKSLPPTMQLPPLANALAEKLRRF